MNSSFHEILYFVQAEYNEGIVVEGVSSAKFTYVDTGKVSPETFDIYVKKDPSKNKKYIDWMCKQLTLYPDKEGHIPDVVVVFDRLAEKGLIKEKDIFRYDLETAEREVEKASTEEQKKVYQKEREKDVDVIVDTEAILIISPRSEEASCRYGAGTKWCTAATRTHNYFKGYAEDGTKLIYIIDKVKDKKYAVAVSLAGDKECFDEKDKRIPFSTIQKVLTKAGVSI